MFKSKEHDDWQPHSIQPFLFYRVTLTLHVIPCSCAMSGLTLAACVAPKLSLSLSSHHAAQLQQACLHDATLARRSACILHFIPVLGVISPRFESQISRKGNVTRSQESESNESAKCERGGASVAKATLSAETRRLVAATLALRKTCICMTMFVLFVILFFFCSCAFFCFCFCFVFCCFIILAILLLV